MLDDNVRQLYRSSHDLFTRSAVENGNSIMKVLDFYDKITELFNNPEFQPETQSLLDLHSDVVDPIKLKLGNYVMTRDKAKDIVVSFRPKLATMVHKYELSGNGAGQREELDVDYGRVDLEKYVDGDDRGNYLEKGANTSYLLYWWNTLDVDGFVQFTICILDKFQ